MVSDIHIGTKSRSPVFLLHCYRTISAHSIAELYHYCRCTTNKRWIITACRLVMISADLMYPKVKKNTLYTSSVSPQNRNKKTIIKIFIQLQNFAMYIRFQGIYCNSV